MLRTLAVVLVVSIASPAGADQKVDEAVAKATEQLQKGKQEDALKTMNKLVGNTPTSEAFIAMGRFQERLGNLDEAAAAYQKAVGAGQGAEKAEAAAAQAGLTLRTGSAKAALAQAEQAVQSAATPNALAAMARALARLDAPKALEAADKAVAAGASAAAHAARSAALLALGKSEDGVAAARKALETDPRSLRGHVALAEALMATGKATEAVPAARKAVEVDPNSAEAHATLGAALLAADPKAWNDAIAEAQDGAFKNPKNPEIQMIVGRIFEADGRYDQAAGSYRKALELDPDFSQARLALVKQLIPKGDLDGALAEARKLGAAAPSNGEVQALLGELLLRKNDNEAAVAPLEQAVKLLPGSAEAHYYLGRAYHFTGRTKEALAPYEKAVQLDPKNLDFRTTYGLILGQNGQYDKAAEELKKVVASPGYKNTAGFTNLGFVYRSMEPPRNDESIAAYKKALELDPKNGQAALGLAWAYQNAKRYDESIAACKQAMQIDASFAPACNQTMAWAYFFKKDFQASRAALNAAEKAGAGNDRLESVLDRIEKAGTASAAATEEAIAEAEKAREEQRRLQNRLEQIDRDVRSGSPGTRARAVRDLAQVAGGDAAPTLAWMLYNDKSTDVRIVVAQTLGTLGPAARRACPQLQAIANDPVIPNPMATKAEAEEELRRGDLQKASREAAARACR
jgi:superkiller protein 3